MARDIVPYILSACRDSSRADLEQSREYEYLRNWNFEFGPDDIATSIYQEFLVRFLRNTFADELGDDLFHDWALLVNVPLRVVTREITNDSSEWFDDVRTANIESRDDIIRKSFNEAVADLKNRLGDDTKEWRWGVLHTVTLQHPFGLQKPLDKVFSIGPFPFPGASTALISGEYDLNEPFAVTVGPSFRQIFELPTGEIRSILPGGQSGQVYSEHYEDQTNHWLHGMMKARHWGESPEGAFHLLLVPSP